MMPARSTSMPRSRSHRWATEGYDSGQVLLYEIVPEPIDFDAINKVMNRKVLTNLIDYCYRLPAKRPQSFWPTA